MPGWVQLEALKLPGSFVALASRIAGAPSRHGHDVLLASALGSVCMQVPPTVASFPQGFNTSRQQTPVAQQGTQEQRGGKTHSETTPWNYSWLCPSSPPAQDRDAKLVTKTVTT